MKPSQALEGKREAVRALVARYPTAHPRVFGSVLHGDDQEGSDIAILVDKLPGRTLFDLGELQQDLENLLGMRVDLITLGELSRFFRQNVVAEAQPL